MILIIRLCSFSNGCKEIVDTTPYVEIQYRKCEYTTVYKQFE